VNVAFALQLDATECRVPVRKRNRFTCRPIVSNRDLEHPGVAVGNGKDTVLLHIKHEIISAQGESRVRLGGPVEQRVKCIVNLPREGDLMEIHKVKRAWLFDRLKL